MYALRPYGADGDAALQRITELGIAACMKTLGFDYHAVPFAARPRVSDALGLLPEIPDDTTIERDGYVAFSDHQSSAAVNSGQVQVAETENDHAQALAGAAWSQALLGSDDGRVQGCARRSKQDVQDAVGGLKASALYEQLVPAFLSLSNPYLSGDHTIEASKASWKVCMASAGFESQGPYELQASFDRQPTESIRPGEIEAARADATCRISARFRETMLTVTAAQVRAYFDTHQADVIELKRVTQHELGIIIKLAGG